MQPARFQLADQANELFDTSRYAGLLELAERTYQSTADQPPEPGAADMYRLASVACRMLLRRLPEADGLASAFRGQTALFGSRALTTAALVGEPHVVALLLQPIFFSLVTCGAFAKARLVLHDMLRLVNDDSDGRPRARVVRRIFSERMAYSYFAEGSFAESARWYREAIGYTWKHSRVELRFRGSLAVAAFMATARGAQDVEDLRQTLAGVAEDAQTFEFHEELQSASSNLKLLATGATEGWVPFDSP